MADLRGVNWRSGSHQRLVIAVADSSVKVPVGSMTCVRLSAGGAIWPTFSSGVMRESRSATRSSMGRPAFLYFGVLSGCAALGVFSWESEEIEQRRMTENSERRRLSIFGMRGSASSWGTEHAT